MKGNTRISHFFLILIAVGIAIGMFLDCSGPKQDTKNTSGEKKQVNLYHYFSGDLSGGLSEMLAVVNGRNPAEQVKAHGLDHEAFKSMILSSLDKGQPPELFSYWAGEKTMQLVQMGMLESIDGLWADAGLDTTFTSPVANAASTYQGRKYLLPIAQHMVVFFYNTRVFQENGLTPPTSWDALVTIADRLRQNDYIPFALGARERWPAQFWFDYLLLHTAGPAYRQRLMEGEALYTDPEVKRVFRLWTDLLASNAFNRDANNIDWGEATRMLCSGQAAMTLMGTWAIQLLTSGECNMQEEKDFDFFAFPVLDPGVDVTALGPVDGIVLTKSSRNKDFAKSILQYFSSAESQKLFSKGSGGFAPSSQVGKDFYSPLKRRILIESEKASHWAFNYDLATRTEIAERGMDSFSEMIAYPQLYEKILADLQHNLELSRSNPSPGE